jgi:hypothetical protein
VWSFVVRCQTTVSIFYLLSPLFLWKYKLSTHKLYCSIRPPQIVITSLKCVVPHKITFYVPFLYPVMPKCEMYIKCKDIDSTVQIRMWLLVIFYDCWTVTDYENQFDLPNIIKIFFPKTTRTIWTTNNYCWTSLFAIMQVQFFMECGSQWLWKGHHIHVGLHGPSCFREKYFDDLNAAAICRLRARSVTLLLHESLSCF